MIAGMLEVLAALGQSPLLQFLGLVGTLVALGYILVPMRWER